MPPGNTLPPEPPLQEMPHKHTVWPVALALVVLAAAALGFFAWWLGFIPIGTSDRAKYNLENTPFKVLVQENAAFLEAEMLFKSEQYEAAIVKYQEALAAAEDIVQEGQIRMKIAHATFYAGDLETAIQMYKDLAANEQYIDFVRAYAVQNLGLILVKPESVSYWSSVFSNEPYASMATEDDKLLTYRNLFDYASSFHPLAVSEFLSAYLYASELVRMQESGEGDPAMRESYLEIIREKRTNGEADLQRIRADENEQTLVPEAYKRRAALLGKLAVLGEASTQEAEQAFVEAMNLHALGGAGADGYMRFYYAQFLNELGEERIGQLQTVLTPFYTSPAYAESQVMGFFRAEKSNQFLQKETLQALADKDPQFKTLLLSLGWTTADFN